MNREELLTKLAMELAEWPKSAQEAKGSLPHGFYLRTGDVYYPTSEAGGFFFSRKQWLAERERLINKPSWDDAPEWDGEGDYPPVGNVCLKGCKKVRILAHTNVGSPYDPAVVWQGVDEPSDIDWAVCNVFAPLRTAAQRAEDEAVDHMKSVAGTSYVKPEHMEMICRALYRAGYRKTEGAP